MKRGSERAIPSAGRLLRKPTGFLACGLGSGLVPVAPGTAGTAVGVGLYLVLMDLPLSQYVAVVLLLFLLGIGLTHAASRQLSTHDHPAIVWDEIVGYLVTMTGAPRHASWVLGGFLLFRVFDIFKPWPIQQIDRRVTGGLGIMLDDLVAGIYAWASLQGTHLGFKIIFG